jgi:hypothetical protein
MVEHLSDLGNHAFSSVVIAVRCILHSERKEMHTDFRLHKFDAATLSFIKGEAR